jgi:glutaredoxin-dependent peroxiredoxin
MQTMTIPEVGRQAPDFRLKGPSGTVYTLSEYRGDKHVLLVFFPLAFSPVCTHQMPEIQRELRRLEALDTVVFGISVDSHWSNTAFARSLRLDFPLLSDWNREASAAYGVLLPDRGYSARASFLVDKQGLVLWREVSESTGRIEDIPSLEAAIAALERA